MPLHKSVMAHLSGKHEVLAVKSRNARLDVEVDWLLVIPVLLETPMC